MNTISQGIAHPMVQAPGHALQGPVLSCCYVQNHPKPCGCVGFFLIRGFHPLCHSLCVDTSLLPAFLSSTHLSSTDQCQRGLP